MQFGNSYIPFIVAAYLLGAIPTSVWVGKWFYGIDIRTKGSGNAGATNTIRILGLKAGLPVLAFDIFKGWFSVWLAHFATFNLTGFPDKTDLSIMLAGAAVLGHIFPVYAGFKGGKGIATLFGIGLALFPVSALLALAVFLIVFSVSHIVSLASVIASVLFPFIEIWILGNRQYPSLMLLAIAIAVFVPITHRKNIVRLIKSEEKKFQLTKSKKNNNS
jgi:acyl phosphate:glycerol-3-phosphate acyltransferase